MSEERARRKLSGILSADAVGYSRLMQKDEESTIRALADSKELMANLINQYRGRVVDAPGDNLLAEFGSVVDAVECAVKIQQALNARNAEMPENRRMAFRIGVNLGDVVEEADRIYGDGVNIASRLEGLAEPGGICVSGSVYDQIENKLAMRCEDLGEHRVKNITKPIRVYRVGVERGEQRFPEHREMGVPGESFTLPEKPSIAVLPFDNLSRDPDQEYLADGMTENIIAVLSTVPAMFVIARNSTFTYKGKPVKVQRVAQDLGVQYVLEGSVQMSAARVRVTAQLIDAIRGHHLWADRYDRDFQDVFALQDEITLKILTALQVKLTHGQEAYMHETTDNLEAWRHFVRAISFFERFTKEDNAKAQQHFEQAVKLDTEYAAAWTMLGWTHWIDASFGFSQSREACFNRAVELAQKALKLDDTNPDVHALMGGIHLFQGQHEQAISEGKKAIALRPNDACNLALLAQTLSYCGKSEEAIALMKRSMRLNPYYPEWYLGILAQSYRVAGRHEKAITEYDELLERRRKTGGATLLPNLGLASLYMMIGEEDKARDHAAEVLKIDPDFSLEWLRQATFFKDQAIIEEEIDALRKAGLK
jgi:adenylate cyclase